jgi:hypothetical protein
MYKSINPHPEKALPHVVTALIDKHRQLAGQIENAQREVVRLNGRTRSHRSVIADIPVTSRSGANMGTKDRQRGSRWGTIEDRIHMLDYICGRALR